MMNDYLKRMSGAMDNNVEMMSSFISSNKRRKLNYSHSDNSPENVVSPSSTSVLSSCVPFESSRSSVDLLKQKADGFETDFSMFFVKAFSKGTSTMQSNKEIMKSLSSPKKKKQKKSSSSSTASVVGAVTPPATEIEEFFSIAENFEHKRFAQQFNYDVVKDVPLQGKYQWVKLKP